MIGFPKVASLPVRMTSEPDWEKSRSGSFGLSSVDGSVAPEERLLTDVFLNDVKDLSSLFWGRCDPSHGARFTIPRHGIG